MTANRDTNRLGESFIFPSHVINDIHIKSELNWLTAKLAKYNKVSYDK